MLVLLLACTSPDQTPSPAPEAVRLTIFHSQVQRNGTLPAQYTYQAWYGTSGHKEQVVEWSENSLPTIYDWNDVLTMEFQPSDLWMIDRVRFDLKVGTDEWLEQGCSGFELVSHNGQQVRMYETPTHTGSCFAFLDDHGAALLDLRPAGQARYSWSGQ